MAEVLTEDPGAEGLSVAKRKGWSEERERLTATLHLSRRFALSCCISEISLSVEGLQPAGKTLQPLHLEKKSRERMQHEGVKANRE